MASLDLSFDYDKAKKKIQATQTYKDLKEQYNTNSKEVSEEREKRKQDIQKKLNDAKTTAKKFQTDVKTQFDQLLDINSLTGGKGSGSISFVKKILLRALKNIEPKLGDILYDESIKAVGCDQQQTYEAGQVIAVPIRGLDLLNLFKNEPDSPVGKVLYEKDLVSNPQSIPFSMNRELYNRTQNPGIEFSQDFNNFYKGASGQDLFDIRYEETYNNITGPWFIVTLKGRVNNANSVSQFLVDYYKSIKLVDFNNIIASIMEALTGVLSIAGNVGIGQAEDTNKFFLIIQRILGLCFDNATEIDVSGVAKVSELDNIDESFFEFSDVDLRRIEQKVTNIKNGVVEFEDCDNVKLPVDFTSILSALESIILVPDSDAINAANQVTTTLTENPEWNGFGLTGNVRGAIDGNFVKLMAQGLVLSLLSPKVLLPIYIMLISLGNQILATIKSFEDFTKNFKRFLVNLISKIGAIFVQELFEIIKRDINQLIQTVVADIANEKKSKIVTIILKLIQLLLIVFQFVSDWRKCKSVVDEILNLLNFGSSIVGDVGSIFTSRVPLPLLFASEFLGGYSESRAFIGAIEEFQKLGIPTGALPDGSPNLTVLSFFGMMKAMESEKNQNGKVQIASGPYVVTPSGLTVPKDDFGIYF